MFRIFALTLSLLASMTTLAQTAYDPKVAYTQAGSGKSIYLYVANGDGTHAVRVATGTNINSADFAPGGGRIAFSDSQGIKVVTYVASNTGVVVISTQLLVAGTNISYPDFSPDGNRIIYRTPGTSSSPEAIQVVTVPGGVGTLIYPCYLCELPRWLHATAAGDAFAYLKTIPHGPNVPVDYEIWTASIDANGLVTTGPVLSTLTQTFKGIEDFDTARTRNALLIAANYPTTIRFVEYNLDTYILSDIAGPGFRGHYSADDSKIVYRNLPYLGSPDYVNSLDLASGVITQLTKKGNYGTTDARP